MPKRDIPPIQDGPVRLRLLQEADLPLTLRWRNQDHIRRWFFFSEVLTPEQHAGWFARYLDKDNDFVFIIEDVTANYRPVGQIALYNVDWETKRAEYGRVMIGEGDAAGKGLALAATHLVLRLGFETLGLDEIYLDVFAQNERAIKIYRAAGFQRVKEEAGVLTMQVQVNDLPAH